MSALRLPHVLLTGFSAFPGAPHNPTEHIVPLIAADFASGHYSNVCSNLSTRVFPVEYESLPSSLTALASDEQQGVPDIVIHLGLYRGATGITLERVARNGCAGHPDIHGHCISGVVDPEGPETITSTLPLEEIHSALVKRGIPIQWSDNAGGYMCNYIFYLSASRAASKPCPKWMPGMVGFVHVPQEMVGGSQEGMELGTMKEAIGVVLEESCKAWIRDKGRVR